MFVFWSKAKQRKQKGVKSKQINKQAVLSPSLQLQKFHKVHLSKPAPSSDLLLLQHTALSSPCRTAPHTETSGGSALSPPFF